MSRREQNYLRKLPEILTKEWNVFFPNVNGDTFDVSCICCPKYRSFPPGCTVPIGTRLCSCIIASIEYHFRNSKGKTILEVGCGETSFSREVIELSGGKWIGMDPRVGSRGKSSVRSIAGEVHHIPCINDYFDIVMGVQTIEHWSRQESLESDAEYAEALSEIWRIVKPGGSVYFDAPIYLHGAPEFIKGDIESIKKFFTHQPWKNMKVTSWRKSRAWFMRKKTASRRERNRWQQIFHHDERILRDLCGKSSYIISITADKPASSTVNNLVTKSNHFQSQLIAKENGNALLPSDLLNILVCPISKKPLRFVENMLISTDPSTRMTYRIGNGVPVLLEKEAKIISFDEWNRLMKSSL